MTRCWSKLLAVCLIASSAACTHKPGPIAAVKPTGFGSALVESSGGKQIGATGTALPQPLVVQVNDESGTAVPGALVEFNGPVGTNFDPMSGLTDASGQVTTTVALGSVAGRYQFTARRSEERRVGKECR